MATLWFAPRAAVTIGDAISSFSSSSTIATQIAALSNEAIYTGMVKDVRIRGGERDVDTLKLLGFNELLDEKRATIIECTMTMAYQGAILAFNSALTRTDGTGADADGVMDTAELLMGEKIAVTGDYHRATGGEKSSYDRTKVAVSIKLADGTNTIDICLNNAYCTSREISLAADGHAECTLTFKCLASNYYEEDDFA